MKVTYSIVAPIFNERENLPGLYRRVKAAMESTGEPWDLVLVDDGSTDGSTDIIHQLAQKDERVRPVIFARNFGHQIAITAGWDYARGDAVVIIDADLQDPPEVIATMVAKWREGFDVVYGVRSDREGETFIKLKTAAWYYKLLGRLTKIEIPANVGDFRLLSRRRRRSVEAPARKGPVRARPRQLDRVPPDWRPLQPRPCSNFFSAP